jgi:hypothetical protein
MSIENREAGGPSGTVVSRDGTTIAYDRYGSGEPVVLVAGALTDRASLVALAQALAPHFTVFATTAGAAAPAAIRSLMQSNARSRIWPRSSPRRATRPAHSVTRPEQPW